MTTTMTSTSSIQQNVNEKMISYKSEARLRNKESTKLMIKLKEAKETMKNMDLEFAIAEANILECLDELKDIYKSIVSSSSPFQNRPSSMNEEKQQNGLKRNVDGFSSFSSSKSEEEDKKQERAPRMNENPFPPREEAIIDSEITTMDEQDEKDQMFVADVDAFGESSLSSGKMAVVPMEAYDC